MRILAWLIVTLVTASAQGDVGKLLVQGAADAWKVFEPVPEMDKSAILTCTTGLLMKHITFRPDGTQSAICTFSGKQHVEWKRFVVRSISAQSVNEADRLNGISNRYLVGFGCDGHRSWDSKTNAWGKWYPLGHVMFPAGVTLEWKGGKWVAVETDQMKYFTPGPGPSIAVPKPSGKNAGLPPGMTRGK
jgi:hypothetical protein